MNQHFLDRSFGNISAARFTRISLSQRLLSFQLLPNRTFNGGENRVNIIGTEDGGEASSGNADAKPRAHQSGVNALGLDIESRLLISGGADASIKLWNLDNIPPGAHHDLQPSGIVPRTSSTHKFGITHLSFYSFDSAAFLSSSYDHHLKLYTTESLTISASFNLNSVIYTHALSPISSAPLVAAATQHPAVRLVDLRSGDSAQALAGHAGAVLSLSWSPTLPHILASGSISGELRLWDIRKSSSSLGVLNLEDSLGIGGADGLGRGARNRETGKAHLGAVNALSWTDDGRYLVSAGHDDKIRVWDAGEGRNTLASFGPIVKNRHLSTLPMVVTPSACTEYGKEMLIFPNGNEVLMFEVHEGKLLRRLKVPGPRDARNKITGLVMMGMADGVVTGHSDGMMRAWMPRTAEDEELEREEERSSKRHADDEDAGAAKKRQVLNDVFRDLTSRKITFS